MEKVLITLIFVGGVLYFCRMLFDYLKHSIPGTIAAIIETQEQLEDRIEKLEDKQHENK